MSKMVEQEDYCLNCKTTLRGDYCHYCGQKKIDTHNESFLHTMTHFIGDFVHFDSQIFRTAFPLLFKPGFLVNEYLKGKRVRYLPPIRMYVFLSFLFFFLTFSLSSLGDKSEALKDSNSILKFNMHDKDGNDQHKDNNLSWNQLSDTLEKYEYLKDSITVFGSIANGSVVQYDSVQQSLPADKKDNWLMYNLKRRGWMTKDRIMGKDRNIFIGEVLHSYTHNFPKVLFFLLPFFALLLKLLYRKRYYIEHLIFSITFYNFFFLFGCLLLLLGQVPFMGDIINFLYVLPLLYLLVAMYKVYRQRKAKTLIKFSLFVLWFSMLLGVGLAINALFSVFNV